MNVNSLLLNAAIVAVLMTTVGCAGGRFGRARYVPDGEINSGHAAEATVYDLDSAVQGLMAGMRAHTTFIRDYEDIKKNKNRKPILQILPIDCNNFAAPRPDKVRLAMVRDKISQSVFESDLFALRDSVLSDALKTADVPDCVLHGTLTQVSEGRRCYVYRLQLVLTEPLSNAVIWQGAKTIQKVDRLFY